MEMINDPECSIFKLFMFYAQKSRFGTMPKMLKKVELSFWGILGMAFGCIPLPIFL